MTINERIKQLRKSLGMTQREFCTKLRISQASLCMMEKDGYSIPERNVNSISKTFGCSAEWLLTGNGEMFPVADDAVTPDDQTLLKFMEPETDPKRKMLFAAIGRSIDRMSDEDLAALLDDLKKIIGE